MADKHGDNITKNVVIIGCGYIAHHYMNTIIKKS